MNDFKVRIIQPGVPEYRRGLFERLGEMYGDRIDLWANDSSDMGPACRLQRMQTDYSHPFKHILGPFYWQVRLSLKGLGRGDVLVICGDVHHFSAMWLSVRARVRKIAVIWWGHHKSTTSTALKIKIRVFLMRILATVSLCYTREGKDFLVEQGLPESRIKFTGNTVDDLQIDAAIAEWTKDKLDKFEQDRGLKGKKVLLFCSVLRMKTHLEQLFYALPLLQDENIIVVVIGTGEGEVYFREEAEKCGVAERVMWIGSIVDQTKLAPWFLVAKAYVYPGPIGLSLIHSFYYGLPVVVHSNVRNQGPEFIAMKDGETGYIFEENNVIDLSKKVTKLLADEERRQRMGATARNIAKENFSIERMARNFSDTIELAHSIICNGSISRNKL